MLKNIEKKKIISVFYNFFEKDLENNFENVLK